MPVTSLAGLHRRVESHLHCQGCDYDLFGLRFGGKCPECGLAIRPPIRVSGSSNDAPIAALTRLRNGIFALLAALTTIPFAIASAFIPQAFAIALGLLAILAIASWIYGVFILTAPLPGRPDEETDRNATILRNATRALAFSWFFVLGLPLIYRIGVPLSPIAMYLVWLVAVIAAGTGFTLLSVSVSRLAAWANDPDLGHHLRGAAVAVALLILGFICLTALSVVGVPAGILLFFYLAACIVGAGLTLWNIVLYLRLASLLAWAPANAQKALDRARARGERIAHRIAENQPKHEPLPEFNVIKPPVHGVLFEPSRDALTEPAIDLAPDADLAPPQPAPGPNKINQPTGAPLPPLPKKKPAPQLNVNRKKDEMI
jgi:hypothetical protein